MALLVLGSAGLVTAQSVSFFRIGTASTSGTYFPIGGILASAISKPPGSRDCERGGSCGVPGLIAVAQSTEGSVDNVEAINSGELESGFSQADVSYWAYTGTGIFEDEGALKNLRFLTHLYPETIHLVVRRDSGIREVEDLRGKRVSLDRVGSGTRVDAILILEAFGLDPSDVEVAALPSGAAADLLRQGKLDGFFFVAGTPANAIAQLADEALITLVPLQGPEVEALMVRYPFFSPHFIPAGTYFNVAATQTLSVGAQWLVSSEVPEALVYAVTQAMWHENTRKLLDSGHPKGRLITLDNALTGAAGTPPLHPGAARYYRERGLIE